MNLMIFGDGSGISMQTHGISSLKGTLRRVNLTRWPKLPSSHLSPATAPKFEVFRLARVLGTIPIKDYFEGLGTHSVALVI